VPLITDSIHTYYNMLANKGLVFQFAFDYTDRHRAELNNFNNFEAFNNGFAMDNTMYNNLIAYADEKGIKHEDYDTQISKDKIVFINF